MNVSVVPLLTAYATDGSWTYDGMRDWEKEFLMEEEWFNIWEYDQSEFGDIAFHEDQEYVIYQEGEVSFDFKEWDFGEPGTTITTRLYCNGANVLIDGMPIDDINKQYINGNTILWNGPLGAFEYKPFNKSTLEIGKYISHIMKKNNPIIIVGGGDTLASLKKIKVINKITYASTSGGAFLEWIEGKKLPGITALEKNKLV